MKAILTLFTWFCLFLIFQCSSSQEVATVQKNTITHNDLLTLHFFQDFKNPLTAETSHVYLENLIIQNLLALAAQQKGLTKIQKHKTNAQFSQDYLALDFLKNYYNYRTLKQPFSALQKYYQKNKDDLNFETWEGVPDEFTFEFYLKQIAKEYIAKDLNYDSLFQLKSYQNYIKKSNKNYSLQLKKNVAPNPPLTLNKESKKLIKSFFLSQTLFQFESLNFKDKLLQKYHFEIIPSTNLPDSNVIAQHYQENLELFKTKPTYHVYAIERKTKEELQKIQIQLSKKKNLKEIIKKLKSLKAKNLGRVKKQHHLPFGIGYFPSRFSSFKPLEQNEKSWIVSKFFQNSKTKKWYLFFATDYQAPTQKPFSRVKAQIKKNLTQQSFQKNPNTVLARFNGGKITQTMLSDFIQDQTTVFIKSTTKKENLEEIALLKIAHKELKEQNFDQLITYPIAKKNSLQRYWSSLFAKEYPIETYGYTQNQVHTIFKKNLQVFLVDDISSLEQVNPKDIILFDLIPDKIFEIEYRTKPENYAISNYEKQSIEDLKPAIFNRIKKDYQHLLKKQIIAHWSSFFPITILDSTLIPLTPEQLFEKGNQSFKEAKFKEAIKYYTEAKQRKFAPHLQDSLSFSLARAYLQNKNDYKALAEHRYLIHWYPESRFNCSSQFMIGFLLTDRLNKDKKAIKNFKTLIRKYPKCSLKEDALFMIKSISK